MAISRKPFLLCLVRLALAGGDDDDYDGANEYQPEAISEEKWQEIIGDHVLLAHGILGCLAFGVFFPAGGIIVRVLPFRWTVWLHAAWQILTYTMALAVMAMGIWMTWWEPEYLQSYHPRIGLVVICGLFLQPFTGLLHHLRFRKTGGRTLFSYAHIFWGIGLVTLGLINGGFGMQLASVEQRYTIIYGVLAAVVWFIWMIVSLLSQSRRKKNVKGAAQQQNVAEGSPAERVVDSRQKAAYA